MLFRYAGSRYTTIMHADTHSEKKQIPERNRICVVGAGSGLRLFPRWSQLMSLQGDAFLTAAYQTILLRDPDDDGMATYRRRLQQGSSKTSILIALRRSAEFSRMSEKDHGSAMTEPTRLHFLRESRGRAFLYYAGLIPILGGLIRAITHSEGHSRVERRLRRLEYKLSAYAVSAADLDDDNDVSATSWLGLADRTSDRDISVDDQEYRDADGGGSFDQADGVAGARLLSDAVSELRTLPPPRNWK